MTEQQGPAERPWEATRPWGVPPEGDQADRRAGGAAPGSGYSPPGPSGGYGSSGGTYPGQGRPYGPPQGTGPYPPPPYGQPGYGQPGYGPGGYGGPPHPSAPPGRQRAGAAALPVEAGPAVALVGALLTVVSAFLTWSTVTGESVTGTGRSRSLSGFDVGDGRVAFLVALAAAAVAGLALAGRRLREDAVVVAGLGGLVALLALADLIFKPPIVASIKEIAGATGSQFSAGAGLYLALVGGLLVVAGGVLLRLTRPSPPS